MRGHALAALSGSTDVGRRQRRFIRALPIGSGAAGARVGAGTAVRTGGSRGRLALGALIALLALVTMTAPAWATAPTFDTSFDGSATPDGSMRPGPVAVNQATGDVYVVDVDHDVVDRFDAAGTYLSQIRGSSTTVGSFAFGGEDDLEVDNSGGANQGAIYVTSENSSFATGNFGVFAFRPDGGFLWQANFNGASADTCGVSVDTGGNLWVSDFVAGVQQLRTADGATVGSPVAVTGRSCQTAFNSADELYVRRWGSDAVDEFAAPGYAAPGTLIDTGGKIQIAVDRTTDYVYMPDRAADQVYVYDSSGSSIAGTPFDSGVATRNYVGLDANSATNQIYVADNANGDVEIFDAPQHATRARGAGSGTGTVTCDGGPCAASYAEGTTLTLAATPGATSTFTGWSVTGDPTSTCIARASPCTVTVNDDVDVTATFDLVQHRVSVSKVGTGSGTVSSSPAGIACGATCGSSFGEGSRVTLTATPATGSTFTGWSGGGCSGTGTCSVTVNADTAVTATFAQGAPTVATGAASGIAQTAATIAGTVNPNGDGTTCQFQYGTSTAYGSVAACGPAPGAGTSAVGVSAALSGLTAGTTYHYRIVGTNRGGTANGADQTFATTAAPPARTCATDPTLCPKSTPKLSLNGTTAAVRSGKASVKLSCKGDAGTTCRGKLTLTMTVRVPARGRRRAKTKTVSAGTANVSIAAGASKTVSVTLTSTAKQALRKKSSLRVSLAAPGLRHALVLKAPATRRRAHHRR